MSDELLINEDYSALSYASLNADEKRLLKTEIAGCMLCDKPSTPHSLVIDHCHDSDAVRGILCNGCNVRLGVLENMELEWLNKAASYIDNRAGATIRKKLVEIVENHYLQHHGEWLRELRELEARQEKLHGDLAATRDRLSKVQSRFKYTRITSRGEILGNIR